MTTERETLTVTAAAQYLDRTTTAVYEYVKQGLLSNAAQYAGDVKLYTDEIKAFKTPKRGRRAGTFKANPLHPRMRKYYKPRSVVA